MELEEVVKFMRPLRKIYKEHGDKGKYLGEEELTNILIKEGYATTKEEAEKIILGCYTRNIIHFCHVSTERYDMTQNVYELLTEEDLIESKSDFLEGVYEEMMENVEPKEYILYEDK